MIKYNNNPEPTKTITLNCSLFVTYYFSGVTFWLIIGLNKLKNL